MIGAGQMTIWTSFAKKTKLATLNTVHSKKFAKFLLL